MNQPIDQGLRKLFDQSIDSGLRKLLDHFDTDRLYLKQCLILLL